MKKQVYSELLTDPRWQKKRLEIMQRDEFKCQSCNDNTKTLNVHHLIYDKNCNPWEYENIDLITLCNDCHEVLHYLMSNKKIGIESFVLVINLLNRLESESLDRYFNSDAYKNMIHSKDTF